MKKIFAIMAIAFGLGFALFAGYQSPASSFLPSARSRR
jgi:hypothetical protein